MSKPFFKDLFTLRSGRRNRKSFILLSTIGIAVLGAQTWIAAYVARLPPGILTALAGLLGFCLSITLIYILACAMAQRCRDIGVSGWFSLISGLPLLGLPFHIYLMVRPGTAGESRFGPDPLNETGANEAALAGCENA